MTCMLTWCRRHKRYSRRYGAAEILEASKGPLLCRSVATSWYLARSDSEPLVLPTLDEELRPITHHEAVLQGKESYRLPSRNQ